MVDCVGRQNGAMSKACKTRRRATHCYGLRAPRVSGPAVSPLSTVKVLGSSRGVTVRCAPKGKLEADPEYVLSSSTIPEQGRYKALHRVEQDIQDYISRTEGEHAVKAKATLACLQEEHRAALARDEAAEEELQRLDKLAREMMAACGGTRRLVDAIAHLQAKQAAAQAPSADAQALIAQKLQDEAAKKEMRDQRLWQVFKLMDRNDDGVLDIGEFRAAMDALDGHLTGAAVAEICSALDIHGSVTYDQFRDIVEAEALRPRSMEANQLRALLHDSTDEHYKGWLETFA